MPSIQTLRSVAETGWSLVVSTLAWLAAALWTLSSWVRAVGAAAAGLVRATLNRTHRVLEPATRRAVGPVRAGLVGRRLDVSLVAVLLAPLLALVTAWWVGSTVGFGTLADWVVGTWTGRDPVFVVFLAAGALVGLGAVSAGVNSGLVPTVLLVAGPLFGAGVTRYGTHHPLYRSTEVVSLPEALAAGGAVAVAFGVPLGLVGFCLGVGVRRVAAVLRGGPGSAARPGEV